MTSVSHMTYLPLNGRSPSTSNSGDCLEHFLPFTVFLLPFHYFPLELTSYLLCVCVCVCVCVLSTLHPSPAAGRVQSVHLICMHACLVLNGHQNVHDSYIQGKSYVRSKSPFHLLFFFARATTPGVRTYTSSSSSTTLPQHFSGTVIDRPRTLHHGSCC